MLPSHLVAEFWETVRNELVRRFELRETDAAKAISSYQSALERHQAGDMVYHRDPESVAETIAHGWKDEFHDPVTPSREERRNAMKKTPNVRRR
jgi:hypothetical protein